MPGEKQYRITYTRSAVMDIGNKADYLIFQYNDSELAETWYQRLISLLQNNLVSFPYKYPVYDRTRYNKHTIRFVTYRNDIVFYYVDENLAVVYILSICTKGQDTEKHFKLIKENPEINS